MARGSNVAVTRGIEVASAANHMSAKMIALCSAAVGMIYSTGYVTTIPGTMDPAGQVARIAAAAPAPPIAREGRYGRDRRDGRDGRERREDPLASAAPAPSVASRQPAPPATSGSPTPTPGAKALMYRDGTFMGIGSTRIGSVEVAVTIKSDKILDVQITRSSTRYPVSYISKLPQEVVARQGALVDVVSGATLSTMSFQSAVRQALAQAAS